ncbi:lipoprotein insertase outer membrane protein LolB [Marinobacter sp. C2H3]|uniref:lipoprotein insertase outer membrane protein LolB n=1 Tax=Marinobacter sp. C2H3 TaxID=3119003 RepID=UPI00300EE596
MTLPALSWCRRAILLALVGLVSACTTIQLEPLPEGMTDQPPAGWKATRQQLAAFDRWDLSGKLAVRQPSDSGTALINHWRQDGSRYELALSSAFLGMGSTRLQGSPGSLELTLANGDQYRSTNPEQLVADATGWQLPLESLSWWIRGLPAPGGGARLLFDQSGQLAMIQQAGWDIRYDRWQRFMDRLPALPQRITAVSGDRRVRLAISQWQPLGPAE